MPSISRLHHMPPFMHCLKSTRVISTPIHTCPRNVVKTFWHECIPRYCTLAQSITPAPRPTTGPPTWLHITASQARFFWQSHSHVWNTTAHVSLNDRANSSLELSSTLNHSSPTQLHITPPQLCFFSHFGKATVTFAPLVLTLRGDTPLKTTSFNF